MEKNQNQDNDNSFSKVTNQNVLNQNIPKTKIAYHIDDKKCILQMLILQDIKKLQLNLEITGENKSKNFYSNSFSLDDIISLNNFFSQFKDYYKAFNYLLNNYTKVDKTDFISNNKINLSLLFSNKNNINNIKFTLFYINNKLKRTKSNSYLTTTIQNLKLTLEKFNSSINELRNNIEFEKKEKDNLKDELQNIINIKLKEIKDNETNKDYSKIDELKSQIKNIEQDKNEENILIKNKFEEIYLKMDIYNKEINEIKALLDKENEKSKINSEKYSDISKKINILEEDNIINKEKNQKFENNINNKIVEINNNISNELSKIPKEIISLKKDDNKKVERIIQEKVNEQLNQRMKLYEEKIQILNKKILDLEIKNQNKIVKDAIIKNEESSIKENINNNYIDLKMKELEKKIFKKIQEQGKGDIFNKNKGIDINEKNNIDNDNIINEVIENKMEGLKKEIFSMINKINIKGKDDFNNLNNKILTVKTDLMKNIDDNNSLIDNKIKNMSNNKLNKKEDYRQIQTKSKKYDLNSSLNLSTSNIYSRYNSYNEDDTKRSNTLFNIYSTNTRPHKKKIDIGIESNILKKEELTEDFFLFAKLREIYQNNRFFRLNLMFRASRDGDSAKNFHLKCDLIGPNIILVKTKKNFIFGGFTNKGWKHLFKDIKKDNPDFATEYKDDKAFGFSVNLKKIYRNEKYNKNVIYCNNNYGAVFINFFKIFDECFRNGGICGKIRECNFFGQEKEYEINGGKEKFDIEEIEVYQIVFR